jgi:tRNA A64-2'-O-ribosylphosphate transferase
LTPKTFWKHQKELLTTSRERLSELVSRILQQESLNYVTLDSSRNLAHPTPVAKIGGRLLLCDIKDLVSFPSSSTSAENVLYLILTPSGDQQITPSATYIHTISGKRGQGHFLNHVLPTSIEFIRKSLLEGFYVCVACNTGRDLCVGVVTAALQLFFNDDGSPRYSSESRSGADGTITSTFTQWAL